MVLGLRISEFRGAKSEIRDCGIAGFRGCGVSEFKLGNSGVRICGVSGFRGFGVANLRVEFNMGFYDANHKNRVCGVVYSMK